MARGRTNFQPFKVFLSLLSPNITFLDFIKERRYILFATDLKRDNYGVQSCKTYGRRTDGKSPLMAKKRKQHGRLHFDLF